MNIQELTKHPEMLNRETLFELRRMTASYPYYQPARLLMIKNLYLLHDSSFDEELRRAALYFTDRKILFNIVEAAHYRLKHRSPQRSSTANVGQKQNDGESRTVSLIDTFLSTIPENEENKATEQKEESSKGVAKRKPTAADATVDYVAYLLATDFEELDESTTTSKSTDTVSLANTKMAGGALIDAFINNENGKITLQEEPEFYPEDVTEEENKEPEEEFLTETLAGIYIKQGRYEKALDIINRINENTEKKNIYAEDQKRFLAKLIANKKTK